MSAEPEVLVESRFQLTVFVGGLLIGAVVFLVMGLQPGKSDGVWLISAVGFAIGAGVCAWRFVKPRTLTLDAEGFSIAGGFRGAPHRVLWRDVEGFTAQFGQGQSRVVYKYRPGHPKASVFATPLPPGWRIGPTRLAEYMNEQVQRSRASETKSA